MLALVMNFGAYWFSDKIALGMTKSHPITEQDDPELYNIVREQAQLAGLPMPKVYEIHTESPNAFATGRSPKNAAVAVTTGIRRILNREELSAVLAHEIGPRRQPRHPHHGRSGHHRRSHLHAGIHGANRGHLRLFRRKQRR